MCIKQKKACRSQRRQACNLCAIPTQPSGLPSARQVMMMAMMCVCKNHKCISRFLFFDKSIASNPFMQIFIRKSFRFLSFHRTPYAERTLRRHKKPGEKSLRFSGISLFCITFAPEKVKTCFLRKRRSDANNHSIIIWNTNFWHSTLTAR